MEDIRNKSGMKKSHTIGLVVCIILMVLQVVSQIMQLTTAVDFQTAASPITFLILIVGFGYYALFGYKKPHGNMLRYLFLFYVICSCYFLLSYVQVYPFYVNAFGIAKIVAFSYIAGRLDKVNKNKYILRALILTDICFDIYNIYTFEVLGLLNFTTLVGSISSLLFTLTVTLAYVIRYDLHKEAGLVDKE